MRTQKNKELGEKHGLKMTIDKRLNALSAKDFFPEKLAKANKILAMLDIETLPKLSIFL